MSDLGLSSSLTFELSPCAYGCIDASIDGQFAARFPESKGARIIIRVDCYDAPRQEIENFFRGFSEGVLLADAHWRALQAIDFIRDTSFSISFDVTT